MLTLEDVGILVVYVSEMDLPLPSAHDVPSPAVDRLAPPEADPDVALEANAVGGGEFEGVEVGDQGAERRAERPVPEHCRVRGAAVLVRHKIDALLVVLNSLGHAIPHETAVYG